MKASIPAALALPLLFFVGSSSPSTATGAQSPRIGNYVLVSRTRVSPLFWHLSYRATLENRGTTNLPATTADLRSPLDILVVDGLLSFGPVAARQSVPSTDTFTLRWPASGTPSSEVLERCLRWTITAANAPPIADAGGDRAAIVGDVVVLDGSWSKDPEGEVLRFAWSLLSRPAGSTAGLVGADQAMATLVPDQAGDYVAQLVVSDGQRASEPDAALIRVNPLPPPNRSPQITSTAVTTGQVGTPYGYQVVASDPDGDPLGYTLPLSPPGMTISATGSITWSPPVSGPFDVTVEVGDGRGGSAQQSFAIDVAAAPIAVPDVVGLVEAQAIADITAVGLTVGSTTRAYSDAVAAGNVLGQDPAAGAQVAAGTPVDLVLSLGPVTGTPIPPPTVTIDSSVQPEVAQIPGFDDGAARPVVAMTDRSGILMHYVENELIVISDDTAAVTDLATRWGGALVRSFLPADYGLAGTAQHLVRIDPTTADPSELPAELQALEPAATNDLRVSSAAAIGVLAAAVHENVSGNRVGLNVVMLPFGYVDRTTTENASLPICTGTPPVPPGMDGCVALGIAPSESFSSNAFTWSYTRAGGIQNVGVGEAWRALALAGQLGNQVELAIIDGGFSPTAVDNPTTTVHHSNSVFDDVGYPQNELSCSNGASCPWHGANVVSAAMGPADDGLGAAGPAGPIARAVTIRYGGDAFSLLSAFGLAVTDGSRVINMSFGGRLPATMSWAAEPFNLITGSAHALGFVIVAAAGNDNADVDSEDCVPLTGSPCWEDAWWTPCENDGVTCVGSLADNAVTRRASSNYGSEDVDLFGPGNLWVGGDPGDPEPHLFGGTSAAAPFVAGVAALVMAADPQLLGGAVEQNLIQTAFPSPDPSVRRYVNAQGAVNLTLGGSPVCTPPTILTSTPSHSTAPCLENVFEITHSQAFGPFQYRWRKLIPGTTTWVDLVDGDNVSGSRTARMTVNPLRPADEGSYDVVVSNLCGSTDSATIAVSLVDGAVQLAPSLVRPQNGAPMAFDRDRNRMVMYGGQTTVPYNNRTVFQASDETWERGGDGVWQVVTNLGPGRRSGSSMAYDEARGVTVLFGGFNCGLSEFCPWGDPAGPIWYTDTWEWDGATWIQVPTGYAPYSLRTTMTYDSVRQRVVMYGGDDSQGNIGTTLYEWDGAHWTPRATLPDPVHGYPPPVLPSPFTFDRNRNVYVLYRVWDTWELDGTGRWARRAGQISAMWTGSTPGGMTYDSDRGRVLFYDVVLASPTTTEGSLWEWTGSTWIRKLTIPLPAGDVPAVAYDSGRRRTVLVHGGGGFFLSSAVHEWRYFDVDPTCASGPP